jgi:zinc resistance-associated protein
MWKVILAGTTALTLIGGSLAYAQTTSPQPGSTTERMRFTPEQRAAALDARITDLKADLHLTATQEKNWPKFETALRDTAKKRTEQFEQMRKTREQSATPPAADRAAVTPTEAADQKALAAALDPLYKSLDEGQKQRFAAKFRIDGEGRHFWFRGQRRSEAN